GRQSLAFAARLAGGCLTGWRSCGRVRATCRACRLVCCRLPCRRRRRRGLACGDFLLRGLLLRGLLRRGLLRSSLLCSSALLRGRLFRSSLLRGGLLLRDLLRGGLLRSRLLCRCLAGSGPLLAGRFSCDLQLRFEATQDIGRERHLVVAARVRATTVAALAASPFAGGQFLAPGEVAGAIPRGTG